MEVARNIRIAAEGKLERCDFMIIQLEEARDKVLELKGNLDEVRVSL